MNHTCSTTFKIVSLVSLVVGSVACDAERSSNPLSPQIAGPLAGVTITTPAATGPVNGLLVAATEQPVTLTFAGATSNSVRPFTYEVQVATDPGFTQIVFEASDVEPNEAGQIIIELSQILDAEQVYYWRVRALDGANTGDYSGAASFEIFTEVVIAAPVVTAPNNGQTIAVNAPNLVALHAEITGPAEDISYQFELATEPSFATLAAVLTVALPGGAASTSVAPGALPYDQTFYWRVRASAQARNGLIVGPWSDTASFKTPPPPVTIDTPTPTAPINGATAVSVLPTLTVTNGNVTGAAGTVIYRFEVDEGTSFGNLAAVVEVTRSGGGSTSATLGTSLEAGREYFWRVRGSNGTIASAWSAPQQFRTPTTSGPSPSPGPTSGPTTPDPPPGGQLPLPNQSALIVALANSNPGALANSCIEEGGSWEFMDLAVAALRATDSRWGYNCKRGNCNDPSVDVVDYFWGIGDGNQSDQVYLIDIIGAVCPGGNQSPSWGDVTQATLDAGTIGRWIYPRP
jgi:hypothetical protein